MLVADTLRKQERTSEPERCPTTEADIEALVDILTPIVLRLLQQASAANNTPENTPKPARIRAKTLNS